ncbi:MAG: hypothetical protein KJ063_00105 [Anaerolineae bacterium]|nr:hypothetical protein [Anaerolineae bacterium]
MSEPIGTDIVQRLMRHLVEIEAGKLSCQDAFALLDEYADLCCHQKEAEKIMPLVQNHLHQCPDCQAFYEALLAILQSPEGANND